MQISKLMGMTVLLSVLLLGKSAAVYAQVYAQVHHHGYVEFCNSGDTDLEFNFVTREGMNILSDRWYANGRYRVDRHSCEYLAEDVSVAIQMYVGVRRIVQSGENPVVFFEPTDSAGRTQRVDEAFCTKRAKFSRTATWQGQTQCPSGYSLQPFRILVILPALIKYTLTVGEKDRSGPGPPQQSASQSPKNQSDDRPKSVEAEQAAATAASGGSVEDLQRAEALRAERQAEERQKKEAKTAANQVRKDLFEKFSSRRDACASIQDLEVRVPCVEEIMVVTKRMMRDCAPRGDPRDELKCLNDSQSELNATAQKWANER